MDAKTVTSIPVTDLLRAHAATADETLGAGRHQLGFLGTLIALGRAGRWHEMWCRLGDAFDEFVDIAVTWFALALLLVAAVAAGAVVGFAAGPVAVVAYLIAVAVAVALWLRWLRRKA